MRRVAAAVAIAVPCAVGCAAIIGADFDAHLGADPADAQGTDRAEGAAGCAHVQPPKNVAQGKNLGGAKEFWAAVYTVDYGDGNGVADAATYAHIGYDIDRVCTSAGESPVCVQGPRTIRDGVDGRDNAAGELLFEVKSAYQALAGGIGSQSDSKLIQRGAFSILFHVSGYNGEVDDDQVSLEWYVLWAFGADKDGGSAQPLWNGSDRWPLRGDSVQMLADGGFAPRAVDDNAYVAGHVVVASLPRDIKISGGAIEFNLTGVFVTATIVPSAQVPGGYELKDGVLAGTWRATQVLAGFAPFFERSGKCTDFPLYGQVKALVCGALDVSSAGVPLPTEKCDALSIGLAFTAKPCLAPANVVDAGVPDAICAPNKDPRNDSCTKDGG